MKTLQSALTLLSLLCAVPLSFGQRVTTIEQKERAFEYYAQTNKAELAICAGDIELAQKYYTDAFAVNPNKPFSTDLLNAFKCAMDLHQLQDADLYLRKLMSRGFSPQMEDKLYRYYKGDDSVFIHKILRKYPNQLWKLGHEINIQTAEMMYTDQEIRKHEGASRPSGNYMTDTVYAVDAANARTLRKLFDKYGGIPNEDIIGNHFGGPSFTELIGHHKGALLGRRPSHYFDTMLLSALITYDISPAFVAMMFSKGDSVFMLPWVPGESLLMPLSVFYAHFEGQYSSQYLSPDVEAQINAHRAKIGLCTLDEMRTKQDYMIAQKKGNRGSKYNLESSLIGYLEASNPDEYEQWKQREVYPYQKK